MSDDEGKRRRALRDGAAMERLRFKQMILEERKVCGSRAWSTLDNLLRKLEQEDDPQH